MKCLVVVTKNCENSISCTGGNSVPRNPSAFVGVVCVCVCVCVCVHAYVHVCVCAHVSMHNYCLKNLLGHGSMCQGAALIITL